MTCLEVAVFAGGPNGLDFSLAKSDHTGMRIMAVHAVDRQVFALEELFILLVVLNKTTAGIDRRDITADVAFAALFCAAVNHHCDAAWIGSVQAAGPVAFLTPDARLAPGADQPWQAVLVALGIVAGGVAGAAVVGLVFFTGMVAYPASIVADHRVGKVVLADIFGIPRFARGVGDDVPFLIDEARLPVVAADDVGDVIPGVALRNFEDLGERIIRGLAVNHRVQLVPVAGLGHNGKSFLVASAAGITADIFGAGCGGLRNTRFARRDPQDRQGQSRLRDLGDPQGRPGRLALQDPQDLPNLRRLSIIAWRAALR